MNLNEESLKIFEIWVEECHNRSIEDADKTPLIKKTKVNFEESDSKF